MVLASLLALWRTVMARRPFHETIVDVIRSFTSPVTDRVFITLLADLIKQTKIPKNHDAIIAEWNELMLRTNRKDTWAVGEDLLEQKREAEAEARQKRETERRLLREDALDR